ncbi:MAG: AAA family ATPase [Cyanobacteria bacterium P01_F01_bin.150]
MDNNILESISIKGFRSIREITDLRLNPINILVGANGSGKSNFIEAFACATAIGSGRLQPYTSYKGGANRILHFGAKFTQETVLSFDFCEVKYAITLQPNELDTSFSARFSAGTPTAQGK